MSINKNNETNTSKECSRRKIININDILIPFYKFGENKKSKDIYDGSEKIPFNERDPKYISILKGEFAYKDLFEIHQYLIRINYLLTKLSD
jgi:hypothetical protein